MKHALFWPPIVLIGLAITAYAGKLYFELDGTPQKLIEAENTLEFPHITLQQERIAQERLKTPEPTFDFPYKIKAPDLVGLENWVNSEPIESLEELKGRVVLLKFWTYSCINCVRTLPSVQSWQNKYADQGLVILGIHAPEFQYERKIENVRAALKKHGLTFPVVQDNEFQTWRAYNNRYWPAQYLIDKDGFVRYTHFGEGAYEETEKAIQVLLKS